MVLTVTEDTPADMLTGSMELLVQLPRNHHLHTQRVTVLRSTPMMDLLVQITTAHKLTASSYTLQAIGERGLILPHHPNTPIGALDALQVKLLPKQGTCVPRKMKQANQPFETTFRLQVHLPRNQLYVSRVSAKMNLGEILDEVCREKNLDRSKYELRHPVNVEETLDLSLSLQDYHLQEVTLYAKQARSLGPTLSTQDIMALQRQEERRRQQTKQSVFGFMFKKSKENSLSTDSLGARSVSPARSDETARSISPLQPPARPQRKRRPAPKPPTAAENTSGDGDKDKMTIINHSRNSSDSSGYHEASVLSDNPDSAARLPETLPRRSKAPGLSDAPRKLAQTSQSSKSLGNLSATDETLSRGISNTSLSSTGLRKKRAAPPPPTPRPLSSAISTQALERIVDSEESLTSDMGPSKSSSDIGAPSKASSDIGIDAQSTRQLERDKSKSEAATCDIQQNCTAEANPEACSKLDSVSSEHVDAQAITLVEATARVEQARARRVGEPAPLPKPRKINVSRVSALESPKVPKRKVTPPLAPPRALSTKRDKANASLHERTNSEHAGEACCSTSIVDDTSALLDEYGSATLESKGTSKSEDNCAVLNENQINQRKEIPETTSDITAEDDASLKSSQYLSSEMESSIDFKNSTEAHFKSGNKFIDVVENLESLNLNAHLSNAEHITLDSIKLNVSSAKSLLPQCNVVSKESENNSSKQDYKISSDESKNERDNSPRKGVTELDRTIERPKLPRHRFAQEPPNAQRETISSCEEVEENVEAVNSEKDKEMCTVISTIPKCEHLNAVKEASALNNVAKDVDKSYEKRENCLPEESSGARNAKRTRAVRSQSKLDDFEVDALKKHRRYLTLPPGDIAHALNLNISARNSTFSDIAEKNREQVVLGRCTDREGNMDVDKGELIAACQDIPSETDILLQKVSDTLSSVLPTSSSPVRELSSLPLEANCTTTSTRTNNIIAVSDVSAIKLESAETKADESNELHRAYNDFSVENTLRVSTPNITAANSSQQDTSDYVSAMGEDLSISDWEYQLPAPPSAFRDSHSPTFDDYDTVTLGSVEAFKELSNAVADSSDKNPESTKDLSNNVDVNCSQRASRSKSEKMELDIKRMTSNKPVVKRTPAASQKLETDSDLRKEVISELENKIETGVLAQTINKDFDRRSMDSLSAPELAPADNTLANFTITTYTRQKSVDIFEELEESGDRTRNSEERFAKTFATLSRNNAGACNYDQSSTMKSTHLINNLSHNKRATSTCEELNANNADCKVEPRIRESPYKWRSVDAINDKTNIQRSKSYIYMSSNAKYQKQGQGINARENEPQIKSEITGMKKATSITDLDVDTQKGNEKFSQWRDNMPKNQEEPTKENQLRSLQVLKSILPQLKNAQQAEENVSKDYNNVLSTQRTKYEAESHEHSIKMNAVSTRKSRDLESECKQSLREEGARRYVYTGPPAISLGSWSERPRVNVQIKTDTDYKLGRSDTTNGGKTIININGMKNEKDIVKYGSAAKSNVTRHDLNIDSWTNKNPDELIAKKLITYTTASNFKIPKRVNASSDLTRNEDESVEVELKRAFIKAPRKMPRSDENEVDPTPMNFRELTKAFDQRANFKQKPKHPGKPSADRDAHEMEKIASSSVKENGHVRFARATDQGEFLFKSQVQQNSRAKRFTSVIGVNGTRQNLGLQGEMPLRCNVSGAVKINPPMPVVKGFKIPTADYRNGLSSIDGLNKHAQPPKPPTMPVITGVTLKNANARPKSMPIQSDPRDMLLESIRNFGGREKLKSTTERY